MEFNAEGIMIRGKDGSNGMDRGGERGGGGGGGERWNMFDLLLSFGGRGRRCAMIGEPEGRK